MRVLDLDGLFHDVDRAPALPRSAPAGYLLDVLIETVVDGELFTRLNIPQAHIENMSFQDARFQVRLAAVIDVLSAGTVH